MGSKSNAFLNSVPEGHERPVAVGLSELNKHIPSDQPWMVVGAHAVRYWLHTAGLTLEGQGRRFNDLDIATSSLDALPPPTRSNRLLYAHREPATAAKPMHYAAVLVCRGIKTDVFTSFEQEPAPIKVPLDDERRIYVPVRTPEAQMVASTWWLARRVTGNFGFGPHAPYVKIVDAMATLVRRWGMESEVAALWRRCFPEAKRNVFATHEWARQEAAQRPEADISLLRHRRQMLLGHCARCDHADPNYPLISGLRAWLHMRAARARGFTDS